MELSGKQKGFLRGLAHSLQAIVQIGKHGITDPVMAEINRGLDHHELIKIKIAVDDQEEFQSLVSQLNEEVGATLIQAIGHTAVFYRQSAEPKIKLP